MKRAIALCGGGTKGIYEIGVWKALLELGIDYQIVTGTSIGAVNGAVMAMRDYDLALNLWNNIRMEDVMHDGVNLTTKIEGMYNQRNLIKPFLKKYIKNKGADVSPFLEFIHRQVDEQRLRDSDVDFGLVTVQYNSVNSLKVHELTKQDIPEGKLKDYIMASSSIYPIFPMHKIDEILYLDGCYYDNLPIDLALKMGADEVIAIDLHTDPIHPEYINKPYIDYILPNHSLGTILNFDRELLKSNQELGYIDTLKYYKKIIGITYMFRSEMQVKYKEQIALFSAEVANAEIFQLEDTYNLFSKTGEPKQLSGTIEKAVGRKWGKYSKLEYFLGGAELSGEIFGIEKDEVWDLEEFIQNIKEKILPPQSYSNMPELNGDSLKNGMELKSKYESDYITGYILHMYKNNNLTSELKKHLMNIIPKEIAVVLFLLTVL